MGRFNRKFLLTMILSGIFLLTGCDKLKLNTLNASDGESSSVVTVVPDVDQNSIKAAKEAINKSSSSSASATPTPSSAMQPTANKELPVYSVNSDAEIEPVTALVSEDSKITSELIVEKVVESLADQSITIGIEKVSNNKDEVIVSFIKDKTPYTNMGSDYESAILDAIAQSLFDNLDSCNKVIYRVEGKAYSGGAFETKINEAYMER